MAWTEVETQSWPGSAEAVPFSSMKTRVALQCDNMSSADPHFSLLPNYINEARNEFVLMAIGDDPRRINLFPELRRWRWYQVTVTGQGYLELPEDMLVFDSVAYTKLQTAYDPSATTEYPMTEETDEVQFGQLTKSSTGWPIRYQRVGSLLNFWPTPVASPTDYRTQLVVRGIRAETYLVNPNDVLMMHSRWHPFVIDLATVITMSKRGWVEESATKRQELVSRISNVAGLVGKERLKESRRVQIAGAQGRVA